MRRRCLSFVPLIGLFLFYFLLPRGAFGQTHSLSIRYEPSKGKEFPVLQEKVGPRLGLAPFQDQRIDPSRMGVHVSLWGDSTYFRSEPFPLEKALAESLSGFLSRAGIKTFLSPCWDGSAEILRTMETDSVLMLEIKRFWTEGKAALFRTRSKTSMNCSLR